MVVKIKFLRLFNLTDAYMIFHFFFRYIFLAILAFVGPGATRHNVFIVSVHWHIQIAEKTVLWNFIADMRTEYHLIAVLALAFFLIANGLMLI